MNPAQIGQDAHMVTMLAEGKNLLPGQSELATSVMETKQVAAALQSSHSELVTHFQRVESGMAEAAATQA